MSYAAPPSTSYYSTPPPPAPPPKQATPSRGPPLPAPPPGHAQNQPSELDASQDYQRQHVYNQPLVPPIEPNWLPEVLLDKSTQDLHHLLSDTALQTALLSNQSTTHPSIPAAESHLTPLVTSNLNLTTSLQALETRLASLRTQTQTRLLALRALEQQHRTKIAETEDALKEFSPQALYARLSAGVHDQEQLLRGLEESWLDENEGGVATEREAGEFVRSVKEARKVAFLRSERRDRWDKGRVGGWR